MSDKPLIHNIKIRCKPKGEILIGVTGSQPDPSGFTTEVTLSVFDPSEPNCTNNPVPASWDGAQQLYVGTGTFNGELIPSPRGYTASVEFFSGGAPVGLPQTGIPVEVEAASMMI